MCIQKIGALLLLLLLLSGCARVGETPFFEKEENDEISIAALFQTEQGDALQGGTACFSTEAKGDYCQLDSDGMASVSGLPRNGELLLTLFDQEQKIQGAITLFFDRGAVIDATTGEDGVGYITVRKDVSEVALIFVLTEDGSLRCTLWLAGTVPLNGEDTLCGF